MEPRRYRPSQAAQLLNISPWTLRRWIREGQVPHIKTDTGRLLVSSSWVTSQLGEATPSTGQNCAIDARESSSDNKAALASQVAGVWQYATAQGYQIARAGREIGSGVNDERPQLHTLFAQGDFDILVVAQKDRLTRFGCRWFAALCPLRIAVVNVAENQGQDLMEDLMAIVTSFSARLYGPRRGRTTTKAAIKALQEAS